ncbi:hypothetical protein CDAR_567621 [Caerostris darwini]|uniref:TCP domain-containing protein n=1 Tax=Caerostris darwini TaxID=1538125 RepID=A0AAV4QZA2_9ARAC|nr:hypothetical protein CDAR_567621 [Caerostris darwini]
MSVDGKKDFIKPVGAERRQITRKRAEMKKILAIPASCASKRRIASFVLKDLILVDVVPSWIFFHGGSRDAIWGGVARRMVASFFFLFRTSLPSSRNLPQMSVRRGRGRTCWD